MVQFHAVALLHALRATDRLAVSKLVTQLTKANIKSPLAQCLLVRYVAQVRGAAGGRQGVGGGGVGDGHGDGNGGGDGGDGGCAGRDVERA